MSEPSQDGIVAEPAPPLVCPACRAALLAESGALRCPSCSTRYPCVDGIADFSGGKYYDAFDGSSELGDVLLEGLALEEAGVRRRIGDYYAPLLRAAGLSASRVLDCGCGNGLSVDLLGDAGFDAWGNDVSALRKWQWQQRRRRDRLVVTDGATLPFPDAFFAAAISSGVIEHVGVEETAPPAYSVRPRADRDAARAAFLAELLRVTRPGGVVFLDCPNGAFPFDFWHGNRPGAARRHARNEGFLPTFGELAALVARLEPAARLDALSPHRRLQFRQAAGHLHGRLLSRPADLFFRLMKLPGFRWLARGRLNPFLVVRITASPT